jgi:energy-coupling factor transporter transmembrane protein EcfT
VFLTAIGFLPWAAGVQSIGIALLAITCVVEALTLSLNYWMRSKSWMRPLLGLIAILGAAGAIYFARGLERSGTPAHHLGLVFCFAIFVTAWAGLAAAWLMRRPTALWGGLTILIGVAAALEIARNAFWYIGYYQAHPETVAAGWMVPTELALIGIAVFVAVSGTPLALLLRGVRSMNRRREALSVTGGDS